MKKNTSIYMDNHATTPVDKRVLDVMMPFFFEKFGNAASKTHSFGWVASEAVEYARKQVADLIGAKSREIIFTSGATESNNLAIRGAAEFYRDKGNHIITVKTEHPSVLDPVRDLSDRGFDVTELNVNVDGLIDLDDVKDAINDKTIIVSVMSANNETGVIQPISKIGTLAHKYGVIFHTDAVQYAGKLPFDVDRINADLVSLSAHKMYGPKGVGGLYIRSPKVRLHPLVFGGGHERGLRSGTLNVPAIVGFGRACEIASAEMQGNQKKIRGLRDELWKILRDNLDEIYVNGSMEHRLPDNLNISFMYVEGESMLLELKNVALSTGSACSSEKPEPSYILKSMGLSEERILSSIRIGLGKNNTKQEVEIVAEQIIKVVNDLRKKSDFYKKKLLTQKDLEILRVH